jgi:uncharacterized LabA/DUF88 family protein
MGRSNISHRVQRCPKCGNCAVDCTGGSLSKRILEYGFLPCYHSKVELAEARVRKETAGRLIRSHIMKALVCIDASNYHYYLKRRGWKIDWQRFRAYLERSYEIDHIYYYEGIPSKGFYFDTHSGRALADFNEAKRAKAKYFRFLKRIGYRVRTKPIGRVYDNTEGRFKHKCNFDVELAIDAIDGIGEAEVFVLCSGDGDFTKLLKYLKGNGKKTVVIAPSERLSDTLAGAANQVLFLENIRSDVQQS